MPMKNRMMAIPSGTPARIPATVGPARSATVDRPSTRNDGGEDFRQKQ